jgi:Protein of unknown function (DUF2846)
MIKPIYLSLAVILAVTLSGCASGPKYAEISAEIPKLKANEGRIYFTRAAEYQGSFIQPEIHLNGQVIGVSKPGGFFYIDRPAGDYTVSTATEVEEKVSFHLSAGETKYIKTSASMGLLVGHITPTLEFPEQGKSDVESLQYAPPASGS